MEPYSWWNERQNHLMEDAKASYDGLRAAMPKEKLEWYPDWLNKELIL